MITMFWGQHLIKDQEGRQKVSTGISPSGPIHVGNLREILTGDLIYKSLLKDGKQADFIYLADDIDPLRKVYPFLPETYSEHVGKPLRDIPAPEGNKKYSEYFLDPFIEAMKTLDVHPEIIHSGDLYRDGKFGDIILEYIEKKDTVKQILEKLSGRQMDTNWFPYNPKCQKCGRINSTTVTGHWDTKVQYTCTCGYSGESDVYKEEGKLPWRLEWPAKWKLLSVTIEPFGKDHGTQGGSYDTGKEISKAIFNRDAPLPLLFERILLKGKGAMHSSTGVNITAAELLSFAPPEIVRFVISRVPASRHIEFDPESGFLNLVDEFERMLKMREQGKTSEDQNWILDLSMAGRPYVAIPDYRHLTTLVQIYDSEPRIREIMEKEGKVYDPAILNETIRMVRKWVDVYAPSRAKFHILGPQEPINLDEAERAIICDLKIALSQMKDLNPDDVHNLVRDIIEKRGMEPKEGFQVIYKAIIGQDSGPRIGYFLSVVPRHKIEERLEAICNE